MDCFMGTTGALIIVTVVLARMMLNQERTILKLVRENADLKRQLEELPDSDKEIIFDAQGGYKVVNKWTQNNVDQQTR